MKCEGMTYPARLGGVLPSWDLTLPGRGYVTGTVCGSRAAAGCKWLNWTLQPVHCHLWTGRENEDLCHRKSSCPSSLKGGEPFRTDKWGFGRQSSFLINFEVSEVHKMELQLWSSRSFILRNGEQSECHWNGQNCHIRCKLLSALATCEERA